MSREIERRDFVLAALAGLAACTRQPEETIVPYGAFPEPVLPGEPLYFATALPLGGFGLGVLVKSLGGRPVKIEGNPEHPATLGAVDTFAQAWLWSLYDPARAQSITEKGRPRSWSDFTEWLERVLKPVRARQGEGLRILTQTVTSPSLASQLAQLQDALPGARWHQFEPLTRDAARQASRLAFGRDTHLRYRFDRAEFVLSLEADFLTNPRYARDFMRKRPVLWVAETMPSLTGSKAARRLALTPRQIEALAVALAGGKRDGVASEIARRLDRHRGASIVLAGDEQPAGVHLAAHLLNHRLGNFGKTVIVTEPVEAFPVLQLLSLAELVRDMAAGRVEFLVMLGGNPAVEAPPDLEFATHLARVGHSLHASLYANETSRLAEWHIPEAHPLESWSDSRAFDGTASLVQPLIAPLYDGKSHHELLAALGGRLQSAYELVREYWRGRAYSLFLRSDRSLASEEDFEAFWRQALHDGFVRDTAAEPLPAAPRPGLARSLEPPPATPAGGLEILFRPDPTLWDGRFAENAWLQELPKPFTKLTWENAACLSPATAAALGLASGDLVELRLKNRSVELPVWIVPGHAPGAVTVTVGDGRELRFSDGFFAAAGLEIRKTGRRRRLATVQHHDRLEGRPLLGPPGPFLRPPDSGTHAWGMAIDLDACTGCGACVVACVAENNVPTVGRSEVLRGRLMHWIRIDEYVEGDEGEVRYLHLPVMCMHCENAPCEPVCPVGATVHSAEGLNEMVYNRCVGSRFCANNCPYKVRRFNFFEYAATPSPVRRMLYNPDVTVRSRGVVEKCTYCVQRISAARIAAARENRRIRDGEVVTACQAACPTEAILFGDLADPGSRIARLLAKRPSSVLLAGLNTKPRTRYLSEEPRHV